MPTATERFARLRRLFEAALDLEAAARAAFVREAAGDDPDLARELEQLLAADGDDGTAAPPLVETDPASLRAARAAGMPQVDGFTIQRCLGAGGMGTVYEAEQQRPHRRVALKTLATSLPSDRARRRFEDEIDILARLRHPAIAQVLEVGSAGDAAGAMPWFAMELVEDPRPIDGYAREHALDVGQRLALFTAVGEAIQFAHQKGVLHRDLKPANVLVDRHGQPKVIDFGIARLLDAGPGLTRTGEMLGTLAYMSPERLEGGTAADDVGADVYALGVILYELLAQRSPFAFEGTAPARAVDLLRSHEPAPPSTLDPQVPRELDWITARAMARDARQRYATVAELLADLERHRRGEPLVAGPPSAAYRLRKLAWRHRLLLGTAAVVFVALAVGLAVALAGWRRVAAAEHLAREESATLAAVSRFQERILRGAYSEARGRDVRLADVVEDAARDLDQQHLDEPRVEIGLRTSIGASFLGLGLLDKAEAHFDRARALVLQNGVAPTEDIAVAIANNLGLCYEAQGRLDLAERELRSSLAARLAQPAADDEQTALAQHNLVDVLLKLGRPAEALAFAEQALRTFERTQGEHGVSTITARGSVGRALAAVGRNDEAAATFATAMAAADAHLHPTHPARLSLLNDRGIHLRSLGRHADYTATMLELAATRERVLGPGHPSTLAALNNVAVGQQDQQDFVAAEATLRRVVAARTAAGVTGGFDVVATGQNLTGVLRRQGRTRDAEAHARQMVELAQRTLPNGHWLRGVVRKELGACLRELGELAAAEVELLAGEELLEAAVGIGDFRTQKVIAELVLLYEAWQKPEARARWAQRQVLPPK